MTRVNTDAGALGGRGPDPVRGHVCPACSNAIEAEGAVVPTARERAVVAFLRTCVSQAKANPLRSMLAEDYPPSLPGWGASPTPRVPNAEPWSHLRRIIERL